MWRRNPSPSTSRRRLPSGAARISRRCRVRTLVAVDGAAYVQAGAGIVADSDPEYEFEETMNKSRAVLTAIDLAREGVD